MDDRVILTKQFMYKKPNVIDGYVLIRPNFNDRDQFRSYLLSPKSLGPVSTPIL